jgi:hypothetical protein
VANAELALKASFTCNSDILAEIAGAQQVMDEIQKSISPTKAPEEAVCSLVMDLRRYCEERKIDWNEEVKSRGRL